MTGDRRELAGELLGGGELRETLGDPAETPQNPADTSDNPPESRGESDTDGVDTGRPSGDTAQDSPGTAASSAGAGAEKSDHAATEAAPGAAGAGAEAGAEAPKKKSGRRPPPDTSTLPRDANGRIVSTNMPDATPWEDRNWDLIRRYFVEGERDREKDAVKFPTLREVSEHFKIPFGTLAHRSSEEGWVEQRNGFQAQVEEARRKAKARAFAQQAAQLDSKAIDAAQLGLQLVFARLGEIAQEAQTNRANTVGDGSPRSGIKADEQQKLAAAADLWHKIGLRAVGDPEVHRVELTGANGRPLEIAQELRRDDPNRLAGVLSVLAQAGLGDLFSGGDVTAGEVVDGRGDDGGRPALEPRR